MKPLYNSSFIITTLPSIHSEPLPHISYLASIIGTESAIKRLDFRIDWGIHLIKTDMAFTESGEKYRHVYVTVPFDHISRVTDELYCFQCPIPNESGIEFLATFDFDRQLLPDFLSKITPEELSAEILHSLTRQPYRWHQNGEVTGYISIVSEIGDEIETNENESYCPLKVISFI